VGHLRFVHFHQGVTEAAGLRPIGPFQMVTGPLFAFSHFCVPVVHKQPKI
jgi:hypothetical protein